MPPRPISPSIVKAVPSALLSRGARAEVGAVISYREEHHRFSSGGRGGQGEPPASIPDRDGTRDRSAATAAKASGVGQVRRSNPPRQPGRAAAGPGPFLAGPW